MLEAALTNDLASTAAPVPIAKKATPDFLPRPLSLLPKLSLASPICPSAPSALLASPTILSVSLRVSAIVSYLSHLGTPDY